MSMDDWKKTADGRVQVSQLLGFQSVRTPERGLVRLQHAATAAEAAAGGQPLQLSLLPAQLRQLAQGLTDLADSVEHGG